MKRILFFLAITVLTFGCKKEVPVSDSIVGTWELSIDGGGWTPVVQHKPGNDTLAVFTSTTYAFYQHNKLIRSGSYMVRKDTSYLYNQLKNRIIYDGQDTAYAREFFDIQNNQLSFFIDAYDAGSTTYRRIK
jgi:hypothetical protein